MSTNLTRPEIASTEDSLAVEVMEAVASTKGVDVLALETTLYEVVDPDALEQLFAPLADGTPRMGGRLVLEIAGCEVTIDATGDVEARQMATAEGSGDSSRRNDH